jgi:glycopeptide antibiotics resistance protein
MEKYYVWFQKHWLTTATVLYILFIFYSTIVPFNFVPNLSEIIPRIYKINWIPFGGIHRAFSRSDAIANILFFIPLGLLLATRNILHYYRKFSFIDWVTIVTAGFLCSASVEVLQIFTLDRHTSITDLLMNTLGTAIGAGIMLIIYLRFRVIIKKILYTVFVGKPEVLIACIFLAVILISYAIPFTFQPSLMSIKHHYKILKISSINWTQFFISLPSQILLFGSFTYFFMVGIYKYFFKKFTVLKTTIFTFLVISIPIALEIFQILVPIRHHSVNDILTASGGVLFGAVIFLLQQSKNRLNKESLAYIKKNHFQNHIYFFRFITLTYIFYLFIFFKNHQPLISSLDIYGDLFRAVAKSEYQLMKIKRLNLLVQFVKEVFTFLPAGFILSLFLERFKMNKNKLFTVIAFLLHLVYFSSVGNQYVKSDFFIVIGLLTLSLGIFSGYVLYETYAYLMDKYEISNNE